jgi:hypothetical protein
MWYYGGMDVPFVDPTLVNTHGLGTWNYGMTTPFFGTPKITWADVNFDGKVEALCDINFDGKLEVLPLGGFPYGTPQMGFNPYVNNFINPFFKTATTPFLGLNNFLPTTWGTPIGYDTLGLMKSNWGYTPSFTLGNIGYSPVTELYKSTLGWTTPITQTLPFTGNLGFFGTQYPMSGYNPFFFNGIENNLKFQNPYTTSPFGLFNTFNTPIDWKVKTFGTPIGMTTDTWSKPVGFPWKPNVISGPVAVL